VILADGAAPFRNVVGAASERFFVRRRGAEPRSLGSRVRPGDFSHPISHRTPQYRVGNGGIGWLVTCQKRLYFGMKRNCKIQDKMGCNGLGNRCSIRLSYGTIALYDNRF
jgi:hypothetical protein